MGREGRARERAQPVSVAVTSEQRRELEAEARRRGLGVSTTLRTLAVERVTQLRDERQRELARRWQTARLRSLIDRIETGEVGEASQADIDAVFEEAEAHDRRRSAPTA